MPKKFTILEYFVWSSMLVVLCFFSMSSLADESGLAVLQKRGQNIYRSGASSGPEITALLRSDIAVSGRNFPCANCHGLEGEGGKEGGFNVPPLRWEILSSARAGGTSLRARLPYADSALSRAISSGLNPAGLPLSPSMPRYQMDEKQLADLVAYLKILGSEADTDPGLSSNTIRVGTLLPITGPQAAIGKNIQSVLQAYFGKVNDAGGVYGRKIELIVSDSHPKPQESIAALHVLVDGNSVFALIANYVPNSADLDNQLAALNVPTIGPINFAVPTSGKNLYRFDLLPSFADQGRCLVTYIEAQVETPKPRRYAVMHSEGSLDLDAAEGTYDQIKGLNMQRPAEFRYEAGRFLVTEAEEFLRKNRPDFVFFFGNSDELKATIGIAILNKLSTRFLTTTAMAAGFLLSASKDETDAVWLAQPLPLNKVVSASLLELEREFKIRITNPAFGMAAYTAADVFTEAVKRSGRRLSRARLIEGLESFQAFNSKFMPPITFGTNKRTSASGCVVVRIDPITRQYVPFSDWIAVDIER